MTEPRWGWSHDEAVARGMRIEHPEKGLGRRYLDVPQVKHDTSGKFYSFKITPRYAYVLKHHWDHGPTHDFGLVRHEAWTAIQLGQNRVYLMCAGLLKRVGREKDVGYLHELTVEGIALTQLIRQEERRFG